MRADRRGHFAERITFWWLRLAGYQIVAQGWRAVTGKIDLIAKRRRLLMFVEVKYRFDNSTSPHQHHVNVKESDQQPLYSSPDIQLFPITSAGLIRLLLTMVKSCLWATSPILKMRGNKRYITLTDESQNATLTLWMSDRS